MNSFAERLLQWFDQNGRKDLPWQHNKTAYRVWVSEIMLQQTQVSTVIDYYQRFMQRFPTVQDLAEAELDELMHYWSGLGYYSRARNLHRCAQTVCEQFGGEFPATVEQLSELPGIGPSTAGAISSIAFKRRAPILDGNVKRVLCRHEAIEGWPGQSQILKQLWQLAETYTPEQRNDDYTQAIMDLGATLCSRGQPDCERCPVASDCKAKAAGIARQLPSSKPKREKPVKRCQMILLRDPDRAILLQKRQDKGVWQDLWCPPQLDTDEDAKAWVQRQFHLDEISLERWQSFRHSFSHYHLDIEPVLITLQGRPHRVMEGGDWLWYNSREHEAVGIAAPIQKLLLQAQESLL